MNSDRLAGLDPAAIRNCMLAAVAAAAKPTLSGFRTPLAVDNKWTTGFDPVTDADRDAEIGHPRRHRRAFPRHGIIGEEWDPKASSGDFDWIVDPIDGTRAFISGVPVWGTLIGLMHKGRAIAGLMAQPFTGETWIAIDGGGEFHHDGKSTPLRTSGVTELASAKMTATSPELFVSARSRPLRHLGPICAATLQLAGGSTATAIACSPLAISISPLKPGSRTSTSRR